MHVGVIGREDSVCFELGRDLDARRDNTMGICAGGN